MKSVWEMYVEGKMKKKSIWEQIPHYYPRPEKWCPPPAAMGWKPGELLAWQEHAFLLRCEGLGLQEIADRCGISRPLAQVWVKNFGRCLSWKFRHLHWAPHLRSLNDARREFNARRDRNRWALQFWDESGII